MIENLRFVVRSVPVPSEKNVYIFKDILQMYVDGSWVDVPLVMQADE